MAKLTWDGVGERFFETGVSQCALFPFSEGAYQKGVAWNGITKITESPSGAEANALYADNIKYLNLISNEDFSCTISAYTYPDEFAACDGSAELAKGIYTTQQTRQMFGLVYKTLLGNDTDGTDHGYILHVIYGCKAAPSSKDNSTVNESPEADEMSWEVSTTPVAVTGMKPTAHVRINSTKVAEGVMKKIEDKLYGAAEGEATLLMPDELKVLAQAA